MRKILSLLIAFMLSVMAFAQNRQIYGRITDEKGDPVPFATIKIKKTSLGTAADEAGNFRLSVPPNAVLEISAAGVETREVSTAGTGEVFNVTLSRITNELSTIVTTSLGIKRQAKELGYAATSINNKTLTQGKAVNVQQALNGKVSGVSVSTVNSGVFENPKINIRGIRSLTGNNQPMLVVDGAPTPLGYPSSIPPDDIQDLTVLKSAASAAIYGPDAVNGVIVVTTKKGTGNKINVTVSSYCTGRKSCLLPQVAKTIWRRRWRTLDHMVIMFMCRMKTSNTDPAFDGSMQDIGVKT